MYLCPTVYQSSVQVYTDGSKDPHTGNTGFAFSVPALEISVKRRTSEHRSLFTVEMLAIAAAVQQIEELRINKGILCSGSCSAMMMLQSFTSHSRQNTFNEICENLIRIKMMNIALNFTWMPAHKEVVGN